MLISAGAHSMALDCIRLLNGMLIKPTEGAVSDLVHPENRVIFIGEEHSMLLPKEFIKNNLKIMKEMGFSHLALEMFNSSFQILIDRYFDNQISESDLLAAARADLDMKPYVDLVRAARDLQIGVLAIDQERHDVYPLGEGLYKICSERDHHMADILGNFLSQNLVAKVAVLIGRAHVVPDLVGDVSFYPPGSVRLPDILLAKYGLLSTRLVFIKRKDKPFIPVQVPN